MNQSETDLGIVNESQLLRFGIRLGKLDKAITDYDAALKINPKLANSLYGRGLAKNIRVDGTGDADLAAAKAIKQNIAIEFLNYGM
jgi:tetratricopeptide (TPR) repeat protein